MNTASQDLNLVPYLDIMTNLVMFLLASSALVVPLREAPILVPSTVSTGGGGPFLTVALTDAGVSILTSDASVARVDLARDAVTHQLPYDALTRALRDYKDSGALADAVTLVADRSTPYAEVVATMDAARRDEQGLLYPGVELGVVGQP